jgi:hypothetical protein
MAFMNAVLLCLRFCSLGRNEAAGVLPRDNGEELL